MIESVDPNARTPDPTFCRTCGDHVDDHAKDGGACEMADCKCRGFEPER